MKPPPESSDESLAAALHASRTLRDAPEVLIERAIGLWQHRAPRPAAQPEPGWTRRLQALLTFDSAGLAPAAVGVRSSALPVRQMLYSAEGRDIDLRIVPLAAAGSAGGRRGWVVSGQVLGPDTQGRVELASADSLRQVALDEFAEFRFDGVASGPCRITLTLGDTVIDLPPLDVPSPAPTR